MATLASKTVLVVGGSSGIGYAVAKGALLSGAEHIIISSSSQTKVDTALEQLQAQASAIATPGKITGETVDARSSESVKALFEKVGEIDHLVWTSGSPLRLGFPNIDADQNKDVFDINFWGPFTAAKFAKIRPAGSITLTTGVAVVKPGKSWSLVAGMAGAVDSLTRGLAVDLAPIRVNIVSPGLVKTDFWVGAIDVVKEKLIEDVAKALLVKYVAEPDEIAEAYLFLMKCGYITGQRIELDGGQTLI